jgi:hypothetical protein
VIFRYIDHQERLYLDHGVTAIPGYEREWPEGPPADGRWVPADDDAEKWATDQTAKQEPADTDTTPDTDTDEKPADSASTQVAAPVIEETTTAEQDTTTARTTPKRK